MDMEAAMKRIPPHSAEAEQAVLGAMLMNKEAITVASEILSGDDFYQTAYGILFNSMVELFHAGKPVDLITLQEYLKEKDVPPEISSMEFARDLLMGTQTSANIKSYAEIVREKSIMRRLIKVNEETANACYLQNQPLEEILEDAQKQVFALAETGNSEEYVPIKQVVLNALDVIERASKTKGTVTGIPTGFIDLDYKLSGLQRSDLVLIAARPSMGKTAFVLNIAQHVAFRQNKAVAIFSLEMSKEQLVNRLFSLESHVDAQILRTGNLSDTDWEKLIEGAGTIGSSRMIIDDTSGITISEMRSKCRKYKLEMGLDLIIIDYLQLMSGSNSRKNESRQQEISEISRSLKGLARELNVPVLALSQLSRAVEQRTDKRPMLSDLRESGAIEQDADVCMFIYRDDYYNPDTEDKNIAEIIIAKQRNGPIGTSSITNGNNQNYTITANNGYKIADVLVDGKSIGAVASYKFVKVQTAHTIEARFATAPMKDPDTGFSDIAKSDYFYDAVKWAVGSKVTSGLTETTFGPRETCTRAQTVTFLWRAAGSPQTNSVDNPFTDVKRSDYYYQAVLWAVANNVTNGVSATSFDPNVTVQRDQVVTFLWRASGKPAAKADLAFSDLADGAFYADAVQWAVAHGITTGTSSTTFAPADGCTRAQIVTFLYRSKN